MRTKFTAKLAMAIENPGVHGLIVDESPTTWRDVFVGIGLLLAEATCFALCFAILWASFIIAVMSIVQTPGGSG